MSRRATFDAEGGMDSGEVERKNQGCSSALQSVGKESLDMDCRKAYSSWKKECFV